MRVLILIALALRLILIPNPGFEADISFWKSWGLATADFGIVEGMKVSNNNYPPPFAYTLGAMVWIYKLFADPHNYDVFWKNTNILFLTISKLLPIIADFGIAWLILRFPVSGGFDTGNRKLRKILALVYLLNPVALADGAWWGQVDSVGVLVFLVACFFLLKGKPYFAGFIYMLSVMTKLQNMIYGPIFFLFAWQLYKKEVIQVVIGSFTAFIGLNIQFILARNMDRVFANLTENYDYFPWMSLMAYNLWWIVSGGHGMQVSDKLLSIGIVNAKTVGLVLFSGFYLLAVIRQLVKLDKLDSLVKLFLENLIIINASFFLFQTQSHDRYAFPLIVFLLLWSFFIKQKKIFFIFYGLFSLFYFYNLHTALVVNYPNNGLPLLSSLTQVPFTLITAFVLLALFFVYLVSIERKLLFIPIVFFSFCISLLNRPQASVSLTTFKPFISEQGYGNRQTNKNIQKNRLSVQYAFYKFGIGTHTNSKHVFDLNKKFTSFSTDFGIDTDAGIKASAIFEIYGDNTLLFRSEKMGRFDSPRHAEVSVVGVKHLSLVTTDAGDSNYDDHTDWLNPMLYP